MSLLFPRVAFTPVRCTPLFHAPAPSPSPLFALFDETLSQLERVSRQAAQAQVQRRPFNPRFDVKEAQQSYLVEGELPGFDSKDISIEFLDDGHTLQIKGRHEEVIKQDQNTAASTAVEDTQTKAISESAATTDPSTASTKAHQPTVEDEVEGEQSQSQVKTTSTEAAPQQEQAVAQQPKPSAPQAETPRQWISERHVGSFSRSFNFPARVNQDAVRASLKDGILAITLPFAMKPESRRIQIE